MKLCLQLPQLPCLRGPQPHLGLALLGVRKDLALLAEVVLGLRKVGRTMTNNLPNGDVAKGNAVCVIILPAKK